MTIEINVPATIANMGPGFDTCGLAVDLFNTFKFTPASKDLVTANPDSTQNIANLPTNPAQNIVFPAMDRLYQEIKQVRPTVSVEIKIDVPVARGLGSSSTAVVAGLLAANKMAGDVLSQKEVLRLATELEGHSDNVAPAILGGMVVSDDQEFACLQWPDEWKILVLIPDYEVITADARKMMPEHYKLHDVVFTLKKLGLLTCAVSQQNEQLMRAALFDKVHQPYRQPLIPQFLEVAGIAREHQALGTVISGSGSTMAVFCHQNNASILAETFSALLQTSYPQWEMKTLNAFVLQ